MTDAELGRVPLFEGLDGATLEAIRRQMQPRRFGVGQFICREGEPGDSLFVLQSGLAQVLVQRTEGQALVARLRRGDVVGEMSLLTGEPRSATVHAIVPTEVLELRRESFGTILSSHPGVLANLTRILSQRLARANQQQERIRRSGETIGLVVAEGASKALDVAAAVIAATQAAGARRMVVLDLTGALALPDDLGVALPERSAAGALEVLDDLLASYAAIVVVADSAQGGLAELLEHMDRILLLGTEPEVARLGQEFYWGGEVVLLTEQAASAPRSVDGLRVIRAVDPERPARDVAWLGRHLSRTKLGLALGAGGAKGFAHIGAIAALEAAGYAVDYVGGSSIGALVGAWLALGNDARALDQTMRAAFTPENVEAMFKLSLGGMSSGLETMTRLCRETTDERAFADLGIPLVVMTVDLNAHRPAPITQGPLWEALLAATALPGMFPPFERGTQRLVDGLALVPVPSDAVREAGADIVVSVNLMSRDTLPAWPGESPRGREPADATGVRMLDTLLEVMDLAQIDSSVRHAARADVVFTPRFGPASWRDFDRADQFLAAGQQAAETQMDALRVLAKPNKKTGEVHG